MIGQPPDLMGLPRPALGAVLDDLGIGRVHARTVFAAVHRGDSLADLGPHKTARLHQGTRRASVEVAQARRGGDGTEKLLFRLHDGEQVEGVLIPQASGRVSFCVSSQVGCAMGCAFCATANLGLRRGLTPGEIVAQIATARARCADRGQVLKNIVFMGMGEPLHHYESTAAAIQVVSDHLGQMHGQRHITVSTVGLAPRIRRLGRDFGGRVQLAVSLSAGTQATRDRLVPMSQRYDLGELKSACLDYPLPGARRFVLLEYVLLGGVTDTTAEIDGVIAFAQGLRCVVNLIPWNPFPGAPFRSAHPADVDRVWNQLNHAGVPVTVRRPRGRPVAAACGQLAGAAP